MSGESRFYRIQFSSDWSLPHFPPSPQTNRVRCINRPGRYVQSETQKANHTVTNPPLTPLRDAKEGLRWKGDLAANPIKSTRSLAVLSPLVLPADLLLLLRCEVVRDVESFADILWRLALDHVGDRLAANVKKGLNIEVVGSLGKQVSAKSGRPRYGLAKDSQG